MKRKVLITGANGFTGKNLLRILNDSGWHIFPLVHRCSNFSNEIVLDFCDPDRCSKIKQMPAVDAVVHLGAKIGWKGCTRESFYVPNVLATAELAQWAKAIGAYFLFASTAIVCGIRNTHITPVSPLDPDTNYGYSKWLAEEMIRMSGVRNGIFRISGIFGRNGPSHLGINVAIAEALKGKIPVLYGEGAIYRNYVYVKDLCNVMKFCIENEIEGTHLVAGGSVNTVSEMIRIICKELANGHGPDRIESNAKLRDQTVEHSHLFPKGRSFRQAIQDCRFEHEETLSKIYR